MPERSYTLTCRQCHALYALPLAVCQGCGPTSTTWDGVPSQYQRWVACCKCHARVHLKNAAHLPEPEKCTICGAPDLGWRGSDGEWWDAARNGRPTGPSVWIHGLFDGNYDGALMSGHADVAFGLRNYTFKVVEAALNCAGRVDQPPVPVDPAGLAPLRLPIVRKVRIFYRTAEGETHCQIADLHDFRLHQWGTASNEQVSNGAPAIVGRFWGTAYARLMLPREADLPGDELDPTSAASPNRPPSPDIPAASAADEAPGNATENDSGIPDKNPEPSGKDSAVDGMAATDQHSARSNRSESAGSSSQDETVNAAATPSQDEAEGSTAERRAPSSPRPADTTAVDDAAQAIDTSSAHDARTGVDAGIRRFRRVGLGLEPGVPFLRPRWWTFLWCAALLLWLVCGWPVMLLGVGALLLHRVLRLVCCKRWGWPRPAWEAWVHPFPMLVLAAFAYLFITESSRPPLCAQPSMEWVGVLAGMLLLSALARLRAVALIIALLWIAALLGSFRHHGAECGQSMAQAAQSAVKTATEKIQQRADDLMSYDSDAEVINSGSAESQKAHRISLARALQDPSQYFTCPRYAGDARATPAEIYLGESALFKFKSDRLDADADAHLRKLAELIRHNPNASIVLTGYTDKLGVPLLNLKLSEQRARSVADWLVEHNVLPYDRIEVRGAGDRDPVVDDPALYRMNRRVEMRIDCDNVVEENGDAAAPAVGELAQKAVPTAGNETGSAP